MNESCRQFAKQEQFVVLYYIAHLFVPIILAIERSNYSAKNREFYPKDEYFNLFSGKEVFWTGDKIKGGSNLSCLAPDSSRL
jgi:hypothetical protein